MTIYDWFSFKLVRFIFFKKFFGLGQFSDSVFAGVGVKSILDLYFYSQPLQHDLESRDLLQNI